MHKNTPPNLYHFPFSHILDAQLQAPIAVTSLLNVVRICARTDDVIGYNRLAQWFNYELVYFSDSGWPNKPTVCALTITHFIHWVRFMWTIRGGGGRGGGEEYENERVILASPSYAVQLLNIDIYFIFLHKSVVMGVSLVTEGGVSVLIPPPQWHTFSKD